MRYSAREILDDRTPSPTVRKPKYEDVPFAIVRTAQGERALMMNIYQSEVVTHSQPTVVYVYGGGWFYGDHTNTKNKNVYFSKLLRLVDEGFTVAAVEYRKGIEAPFPAQIHDVKGSVRFLRANAEKYSIDINRIGVMGESAGGHLTALMAMTAGNKELEGTTGGNCDYSSEITAAVDFYGPTRLMTYRDDYDREFLAPDEPFLMPVKGVEPEQWGVYSPDAMLVGYCGEGKGIDKLMKIAKAGDKACEEWKYIELAEKASPMNYINENTAPMMILQGMHDILMPEIQSEHLFKALCRAGADVWYMCRNFATHGPTLGDDCDEAAIAFIRRQLEKQQ